MLTFRFLYAVGSCVAREQLLSSEKNLKMFQKKRVIPNYRGAWLSVAIDMALSKNDQSLHTAQQVSALLSSLSPFLLVFCALCCSLEGVCQCASECLCTWKNGLGPV